MSVRPEFLSASPSLSGSEGELVSIYICVEPRLLESLLEALALVSFPINPQIYHQAGVGYVFADGREEIEPVTMVEFPAFSARLPEVRNAVRGCGLGPEAIHVRNMLEDIHSDCASEPAPQGAPYCRVNLYKHLPDPLLRPPA